jgi:hypothetical protein
MTNTRRWTKVERSAMPKRIADMEIIHGTKKVYFPEINIKIGKAMVRSDAAIVKSGVFINAFSSEGYHPSTKSPTMLVGWRGSSWVCWISAMKLY